MHEKHTEKTVTGFRRNGMRQFKEQTKKVKEVTSMVCNKCGRVIPVVEKGFRRKYYDSG